MGSDHFFHCLGSFSSREIGENLGEAILAGELETPSDKGNRGALATTILSLIEGALLQTRVSQDLTAFEASAGQLLAYLQLLKNSDSGGAVPTPSTLPTPSNSPVDWRSW